MPLLEAPIQDDERTAVLEVVWKRRGELVPDGARVDRAALLRFFRDGAQMTRLSSGLAAAVLPESLTVMKALVARMGPVWVVTDVEQQADGGIKLIAVLARGGESSQETFLLRRTASPREARFFVLSLEISDFTWY